MAGLHSVVDEVWIIEGFLEVLINAVEVGIENICNIIQLPTNTAR